ncbi:MAG TPA: ACP S-malonyltransferase [Wenzhouxiangella sp.]
MGIAVIFPGQGSQSVGMLAELSSEYVGIRDAVFKKASDRLGYDVGSLVVHGPLDKLNQTQITQPILLTVNHVLWKIWSERFGEDTVPIGLAGHSLGEFNALVAAGCLSFEDALALVALRGQLMQQAVPQGMGAMAAILGLPDDVVEAICREVAEDEVVAPANYNSPGQLVIAGHASAVERAMLQAKEAGAKRAVVLPVSVPSHCALMSEASQALAERLDQLDMAPPSIPVFHNVDAKPRGGIEEVRAALVSQLAQPVHWTATIRALTDLGVECFYECGPGRVLTGLGKRIEKSAQWIAYEQEASQ